MAYYAFLDENNLVTEVIPGVNENELIDGQDPETWYGNFRGQVCKRTSYNNNIRGRFAGIGMIYDPTLDIFIGRQPYPSWTLDGIVWIPPIPYPDDGQEYIWNESTLSWDALDETPSL